MQAQVSLRKPFVYNVVPAALLAALVLLAAAPSIQAQVVRANTSGALNTTGDWVGGAVPTSSQIAQWDNTVSTSANDTAALGGSLSWLGINVVNPASGVVVSSSLTASALTVTVSTTVSPYFTYSPSTAFVNGNIVFLAGTTAPTGFTAGTPYYVVGATSTSFNLSATSGGSAITPTSAGTAVTVSGPVNGNTLTLGSSGLNLASATKAITLTCPVAIGANQTWNTGNQSITLNGVGGIALGANTVTIGGGGTVYVQYNNEPTTMSTSSSGAGIILNGVTVACTQEISVGGQSVTSSGYLGANTALTVAGSTYSATSVNNSGTATQPYTSLTLNPGVSLFQVPGRGSSSFNKTTFGAITHNAGGVADFSGPSSTQFYGIAGSSVLGYGTYNATDWALEAGTGTSVGAATYVSDTWSSANNVNVTTAETPSSGSSANTLRFAQYPTTTTIGATASSGATSITVTSATGMKVGEVITCVSNIPANTLITSVSGTTIGLSAAITAAFNATGGGTTVTIGAGNNTVTLAGNNTLTAGGILQTYWSGNTTNTITGGNLTTGNGADLVVINNDNLATGGNVVINSAITDNGGTHIGLTAATTTTSAVAGYIALGGANTFTGSSYIDGANVVLNSSGAWGGSAPLYFAPRATLGGTGGTLNLNGNSTTLGGLGTTQVGMTAPTVQNANSTAATLTINGSAKTYFGGLLKDGTGGGALSFTMSGTGIQTNANANTYSGTTTLSGGTLNVGYADVPGTSGPLGSANTAGSIVFSGGTIQFSTANQHDYSPRFSTAASQSISVDLAAQAVTFGTALTSSSGTLTVADSVGGGVLTLTGVNTFNGGLTVKGGLVGFASDGSTGGTGYPLGVYPSSVTAADVTLNGGGLLDTTSATISANRGLTLGSNGGTLDASSAQTLTVSSIITGSGGLTKGASSGIVALNAVNTYTGATTISGGTLSVIGSGQLNSGSYAGNISDSGAFIYNSSQPQTLSGNITGSGTVTFSGSGTVTLSGASTVSGGLTLTGGTVSINGDGTSGGQPLGAYPGSYSAANVTLNGSGAEILDTVTTTIGANRGITLGSSGGTLDASSGQTLTVSSIITGTGALTKGSAAGTVSLNGVNTYTGATTISGGTLVIGGSGQLNSGSYGANISDSGTFKYNSSVAQTLSGVISGSGNVTQVGSGKLTLSGANTYSGVTAINGGILNAGVAEVASTSGPFGLPATPVGSITFGGGTLQYSSANQVDYSGRFSTAGSQSFSVDLNSYSVTYATAIVGTGSSLSVADSSGGGTLLLTAAGTYSGATSISGSGAGVTLQSGLNNALPTGTTVTFGNGASTIGILDLNGYNQQVGGLAVGSSATGSSQVIGNSSTSANSTLTFNGSGTSTFGGLIKNTIGSGTETVALTVSGGTLSLSGASTFTGGVNLNGGVLSVNGAESPGTSGPLGASGTISFGGGTLQFTTADSADYSPRISTAGSQSVELDLNGKAVTFGTGISGSSTSLTIGDTVGAGSLTLSGANTYTGATAVNAGTLVINGSIGSGAVTVASGATLSGLSGALGGNLTMQSGASFLLTQGSALSVSGSLTLNGNSVKVNAGSPLGAGTYVLLTASGGISGTPNVVPAAGSAVGVGSVGHVVVSGNNLEIVVTTTVTATWTNGDSTGLWADALNWSGGAFPTAPGDSATFPGGVTGSVTLNANEAIGALTLNNSSSVVLSGVNTLTLDNQNQGVALNVTAGTANQIQTSVALNDNVTNTVTTGDTLTLSGTVTNALGVTKTLTVNGAGTTALTAANAYGPAAGSVGTIVSGGGTLQVGNNTALGAGDVSVAGSATLQATPSTTLTLTNNIAVTASQTATVDNNATTLSLNGVISGSGNVVATGSGTVSLTATNTFTGTTTVNSGATLALSNAGKLGTGGSYAGNITDTGTLDYNSSAAQTLSGIISGAGALTAAGSSTLTLSGANTYTGNSTLNSGIVNVNATETAGTSGPLGRQSATAAGTIIFGGGILQFSSANHNDYSGRFSTAASQPISIDVNGQSATFATALSSSGGTLTVTNSSTAGALTLSASETYSGATTIGNGTLTIGGAGKLGGGTYSAALTNNGALNYNSSAAQTLSGVISGTGSLTNAGTGALTLSGVDTFTGTVTINSGDLVTIGGSGQLSSTGTAGTYAGNIFDNGTFNYNSSAADTLSGVISGSGGVTNLGAGTLTLSGGNTFSGGLTLNGGIVSIASDGTTGGAAANLGVVPASLSTNLFLNGGDLLAAASLAIHTNRTIGIGPVSGVTGATGLLDAAAGQTLAINGTIASAGNSGTDNLTVNSESGSTGKVQLGGTNTFNGTTTISAGTLALTNSYALEFSTLSPSSSGGAVAFGPSVVTAYFAGLSGTGNLALTNAAGAAVALLVGSNNAGTTYSGNLSGSGSLTKTGSGIFILAGSNNITGNVSANGGTLYVNSGAVLSDATYYGNAGVTTNNGGYFTNTTTYFYDSGAGFAQPAVGAVSSLGALNVGSDNGTGGGYFQVSGGTVDAASINIGRSGLNYGASQPAAGSTSTGIYLNGANLNVTGHVAIGADSSSCNSSANIRLDNSTTTIGGSVDIGLSNGSRWSDLDFNGGSLTVSDGTTGVQIGNGYSGNAVFLVRGGTAMVNKITFGQSGIGTMDANLDQTGGSLYLGSGGIVQGSVATGFVPSAIFASGILGASNTWSSSMSLTFNGGAIMAADSAGTAHNITLSGAVEGTGPITKMGGGTLTMSGANGYFGGTIISNGIVNINGFNALGGADYRGLSLRGGTLQYATAFSGNGGGDITAATTYTLTNGIGGGTIDVNGNSVTYAGVIVSSTGAGVLNFADTAGGGLLNLQGASTYAGNTTISSGTVLANNASGSATGTGTVEVESAATLGGLGTISGAVTFDSGSFLKITNGSPLAIGVLTANGNTVKVFVAGSTALASGSYTLLHYTSAGSSGTFNATPTITGAGLEANSTGTIVTSGGTVKLVVTENTTTALAVTTGSSSESYGSALTITATVASTAASPTSPTGSVIFKNGGTTLATVALSGGTAAYTPSSFLPVSGSPYSITAYYQGDSTHNTSDSSASPLTQTITQATPTLALASSSLTNGYLANLTFTATVQTNGAYTAGDATGTVQFQTNTLGGSPVNYGIPVALTTGAVSTNLATLPRGTNYLTAIYSGDANYAGVTSSEVAVVVTNHPPVAANLTISQTEGLTVMIPLSSLATNWSDADGDPITLTNISTVSANSQTVYLLNITTNVDGSFDTNASDFGFIGYANTANTGTDTIQYTITDNQGGVTTGNIYIVASTAQVNASWSASPTFNGSSATVNFAGTPGFTYGVQRATNMSPPLIWVNIPDASVTILPGAGAFTNFIDDFTDLGGVAPQSAFYRLFWQPASR
jgi:autotransporter-associated beta strand protein